MARELSTEDRRLCALNARKYGSGVNEIGPAYPDMGASVAKYRRLAAKAGSIAAMSLEDRRAYADAVEREIHCKNNAWWRAGAYLKVPPGPKPGDVGAAIRAQQKARLSACPAAERAARKPEVWEAMYAAAMAEKRAGAKLSAEGRKRAIAAYRAETPKPETPAAAKPATDWSAAGRKAWATRRAKLAAAAA